MSVDQVIVRILNRILLTKTLGVRPVRMLLGREEMAAVERLAEREADQVRKVDEPGRGARIQFAGLPVEAVACRRCVGFEMEHGA